MAKAVPSDIFDAAVRVRDRYAEAHRKAEDKVHRDVAEAARTKTHLADHYWQEEHIAHQKLIAAQNLVKILDELSSAE